MQRSLALVISASIAAGCAFANQIQIGGVNGLTGAYVSSGCSTNVVGQTCIAGSAGGFQELNYDTRLFISANQSGTAPTPYAGYTQNAAHSGTLTDSFNGITYSMINDGLAFGSSENFWAGINNSGTGTSIVVPIGIYSVTGVGTLINNIWGTPGANNTTIEFDFGSNSANVVTSSLVLNLINAGAGPTASGQIDASVSCSSQTPPPVVCNSYAIGPTASTSVVNGITINTSTLYSSAYDTATVGKYTGSAGTLYLNDQVFLLGNAYLNQYLVDIKITEHSGVGQTSQTALSAITVVAAPEPSSVFLALTGLGAFGLTRLRRRK
jgi:hypothetical protein